MHNQLHLTAISYPEQLAQHFDFTDGRYERYQNHNKASKKRTGFEFDLTEI